MSSDTDDQDAATQTSPERDENGDQAPSIEIIEAELVALADEMSAVIEGGPAAEREALHDYAVSLVRDRLPVAVSDGESGAAGAPRDGSRGNGAANLFGYGILLIPVGLILVPVFGLVGFMLLLVGVVLASIGLVSGLVGRIGPGASD